MGADERGASPIALVTGANRSIGFEVCHQLARRGMKVVLGARDPEKAQPAAKKLSGEGLDVPPHTVDVSEDKSVGRLAAWFEEEIGRLDVLVNNAGINFDYMQRTSSADLGMVHETLETNLFGAWRLRGAPTAPTRERPRPDRSSPSGDSYTRGSRWS
jgi:NAD(P)-dependent dehydrogenase (short-subunit alcohol dehydrogenase family)